MIIKKYIDLENTDWSCGIRTNKTENIASPEFHCYVTIKDTKGFHTVLGNILDEMLELCYEEFQKGMRNNFPPYILKRHHKTLSEKIKEIL